MTTASGLLISGDEYSVEYNSNGPEFRKYPLKLVSTSVIESPKEDKEDIYTILKRILPYDLKGIAEKNVGRQKLRNLKQAAAKRSTEMSHAPDSESDLQRVSADTNYFSELQSEFINREVEIEG